MTESFVTAPVSSPSVPDPEHLSKVQELCELSRPYERSAGRDSLFVEAMRQGAAWHAGRSEFYRKLLAHKGVRPEDLRQYSDLSRLPFVLASFFKSHEVLSIDRSEVFAHFTSSGTLGQKSQVFFDAWSMKAGQRMVDRVFESEGWVTPESPVRYLLYTYETDSDSKLGTAHTDNFLCKYAPAREVFYALRRTGAPAPHSHEFDVFGSIETLRRYERAGEPVRIFGFPSFLHFTLRRMRDLKMAPLKLSEHSLVVLGGGWKGNADQAIPKLELYREVVQWLGIPDHRIRDSFGAVEHAIPYTECRGHHFHIPVWSDVIIRDVRTLQPLGYGKPGFLQFLTPYITSMPAQSVLMGDLASLHPGSSCPCGISAPFFEVLGRAGTSKNKSCAIAASELLGRRG